MGVLEAAHYQETRERLAKDPIVIGMAATITADMIPEITHEAGHPVFEFMLPANDEYAKRGGTDGGHIGAVAEAILMIVKARG